MAMLPLLTCLCLACLHTPANLLYPRATLAPPRTALWDSGQSFRPPQSSSLHTALPLMWMSCRGFRPRGNITTRPPPASSASPLHPLLAAIRPRSFKPGRHSSSRRSRRRSGTTTPGSNPRGTARIPQGLTRSPRCGREAMAWMPAAACPRHQGMASRQPAPRFISRTRCQAPGRVIERIRLRHRHQEDAPPSAQTRHWRRRAVRMQASMALGLGTVRRWVPPRHSVAPNPSSPLHRPWTMALRGIPCWLQGFCPAHGFCMMPTTNLLLCAAPWRSQSGKIRSSCTRWRYRSALCRCPSISWLLNTSPGTKLVCAVMAAPSSLSMCLPPTPSNGDLHTWSACSPGRNSRLGMTAWCPRISMRHTNTRHSTRSCIRSRSLLQKHDNHRRSNIQHMFPKLQQHLIWEVAHSQLPVGLHPVRRLSRNQCPAARAQSAQPPRPLHCHRNLPALLRRPQPYHMWQCPATSRRCRR
mmetsp:Transcript_17360/g.51942  ORF Transcript_17360/g.51942 Transcript_17360/m.51942 type:complete len:470 (+) Transcript_17360:657-2066(+)